MSFTTGIYNINDVSCTVGTWTIQAPASEQPYITERTEPKNWKKKIGSLGQGTIVFQPDRSGIIRVKVKQNSIDDNKILHSYTESGLIFPCTLENSVTKERAFGQHCFIEEVPRLQFNSADEAELEYLVGVIFLTETRGK